MFEIHRLTALLVLPFRSNEHAALFSFRLYFTNSPRAERLVSGSRGRARGCGLAGEVCGISGAPPPRAIPYLRELSVEVSVA